MCPQGVVENGNIGPVTKRGANVRKMPLFQSKQFLRRIKELHDVRKRADGKDVIKQNGSGDAEVAITDVFGPRKVFPDRSIPIFAVTVRTDVKTKVFTGTGETNVAP